MSERTEKTKVESRPSPNVGLFGRLVSYDPYKVFDSRKGCITAVALSVFLIIVFVLNAALNGNWLSLIFVPLYLLIIRNRLRKLREMA